MNHGAMAPMPALYGGQADNPGPPLFKGLGDPRHKNSTKLAAHPRPPQPWDYWAADGVTPKGHALEIVSTLEEIIRREPNHPGALHLYIHAVEASTTPERAEAAADRLFKLMPDAGHIVHMPSHIYYRVGRYQDAVHVNELAAKVDQDSIAACKAHGYYPLG